jgi:hypothetical protein
MMALGTGKALQLEQIRKANAIDKLLTRQWWPRQA